MNMVKPSVTFAIPAYWPARDYGGPIGVVEQLASGLIARGHEVQLLTSTASALGEASLSPGETTVAGLPVRRLPTPMIYRWSPWVAWGEPVDTDILHVVGAWNGLSYSALSAGGRATTLWEPMGMLAAAGRHRRAKKLFSLLHRGWAKRAGGVLFTSQVEAVESRLNLDKTRVFERPNPVQSRFPASDQDAMNLYRGDRPGPLWGYLGRIDQRKGVEVLLQAWKQADAPGQLLFAGPRADAELATQLEQENSNLSSPIHWFGRLDQDQRWQFLRAIDCLVLTPTFGENFGNVVVEALSVGTPVLVTPAVGAAQWCTSGVHEVRNMSELIKVFAQGEVPSKPVQAPVACQIDQVLNLQVDIYQQLLEARGAAH